MYSVNDVSQRYSVNLQTVLGWIANGELKAINVGRAPGRKKPRWRITQDALDAFELRRTPTTTQPRAKRRQQPADVVAFY
jgi:hypothetical protein